MMNKEQAITAFLKNFKISLNNASIYPQDHPSFVGSVQQLTDTINVVFDILPSLKMGIAPKHLVIDGENFEKDRLYEDVAEFFHRRKIKNIEFKKGISKEELITFLKQINLPPEDIISKGDFGRILHGKGVHHVLIEGLDYSGILEKEGKETQDIWDKLLKEEIEEADASKLNKIEASFASITKKIKVDDFLKNDRLRKNISKLFDYLKTHDKAKLSKCSKILAQSILREKNISGDTDLEKLKSIFENMDASDLSQALWDDMVTNDNFDSFTFNIFSKLTGEERQKDIADSLTNKIKENKELLNDNPEALGRIKELFSASGGAAISEVYRKALSSFLETTSLKEGIHFDEDILRKSFYFMLLNSLVTETTEEGAQVIINAISKELDESDISKNIEIAKSILKALKHVKKESPHLEPLFLELQKKISSIIENIALSRDVSFDVSFLLGYLEATSHDKDFYLKKMFEERIVNPYILNLFFKFFPNDLDSLYKQLQKYYFDVKFIKMMIDNIKQVDSPLGLEALKYIFSFSNIFIKNEAIEAINSCSTKDYDFLLSILKIDNFFLKKKALEGLLESTKESEIAAETLLCISNPLGIHNRILHDNIRIIDELDLKEARTYLSILAEKKFIWNRGIRRRAKEVLAKWENE